MKNKAAEILMLSGGEPTRIGEGIGYNNLALYVSPQGALHKYGSQRVIVKFLRPDSPPERFAQLCQYHRRDFKNLDILKDNPRFQQSLDAGIFEDKYGKEYPYVILQYIEGKMFQDYIGNSSEKIPPESISDIISQIICSIIIPAWDYGLRFYDIQGRNFILSDHGVVMIDTEQIRRSATELLRHSTCWNIRDKVLEHLAFNSMEGVFDGMGKIPVLIANAAAAGNGCADARLRQDVSKFFLKDAGLAQKLSALGRGGSAQEAKNAADEIIRAFIGKYSDAPDKTQSLLNNPF